MNYGLGFPASLDATQYNDNPAATAFARTVGRVIESHRKILGEKSPPLNALVGLLDPATYPRARPWFEFLTDREVIDAVTSKLKISRIGFLTACIELLRPPNWETVFWMRAFLESANTEAVQWQMMGAKAVEAAKAARREVASNAALAKLAADPKQKAKRQVHECWLAWQESTARYSSKAAFALDMLGKYEALQSQTVIERWCRLWERGST